MNTGRRTQRNTRRRWKRNKKNTRIIAHKDRERENQKNCELSLRGRCKIEDMESNQIQQEFKDVARNVAVPLPILGPDLISWQ